MRNVHYFFPHFRWNSTVYVHGNDLHLISTLSLNSDHAQSCTCERAVVNLVSHPQMGDCKIPYPQSNLENLMQGTSRSIHTPPAEGGSHENLASLKLLIADRLINLLSNVIC